MHIKLKHLKELAWTINKQFRFFSNINNYMLRNQNFQLKNYCWCCYVVLSNHVMCNCGIALFHFTLLCSTVIPYVYLLKYVANNPFLMWWYHCIIAVIISLCNLTHTFSIWFLDINLFCRCFWKSIPWICYKWKWPSSWGGCNKNN